MTQFADPHHLAQLDRRSQALALRREGHVYRRIGELMGITTQAAHELVMRAVQQLNEELKENVDEVRRIELERLDRIVRLHMPKLGDPRSAELVLKTIERRAKLLGFDAPAELSVGGGFGNGVEPIDAREELMRRLDELASRLEAEDKRAALTQRDVAGENGASEVLSLGGESIEFGKGR